MENLTEKDFVCISRLLQGSIFENDLFYGCKYCAYSKECEISHLYGQGMYINEIRSKLQRITGIDLGFAYNPCNPQEKFAYQNTLESANLTNGHSSAVHSPE